MENNETNKLAKVFLDPSIRMQFTAKKIMHFYDLANRYHFTAKVDANGNPVKSPRGNYVMVATEAKSLRQWENLARELDAFLKKEDIRKVTFEI